MRKRRNAAGFSLLELLIVVAVAMVVIAIAIPNFVQMMRNNRISGDATALNSEIMLAKMRAASRFTQVRVRFNGANQTYQTEWWSRYDNRGWVPEATGGVVRLSQGVNFGWATMAAPPAGSDQPALAIPPACMTGNAGNPNRPAAPWEGGVIPRSACIVFNSRGFPIDNTLTPTNIYGVYINNTEDVFGVTLTASGLSQIWRNDTAGTAAANWTER